MLLNARSYCCKFSQTSDAFELASTIALVLQASRLIKWGSHPQNQKAFFYYFILKLLLMREHLNKIKKRNNNNNNKNKMKSDIRYIIYIAISTKQLNMSRSWNFIQPLKIVTLESKQNQVVSLWLMNITDSTYNDII